jgi:NDP-sugar pyrophosphorylase family protein
MMQTPTLLVLAAGMGSRYGGLKQLDPMGPNGETLLDYSVHDALKAGFGRIVFVIRRDLEAAFRDTVGKRYEKRIPIAYAFQELDDLPAGHAVPDGRVKPWGTGQAVLAARDLIEGPFAVINADDFYGADAYGVLNRYFSEAADSRRNALCLVAYQLDHTLSDHGSVNRGICRVDEDKLASIAEVEDIRRDETGRITGQKSSGEACELSPDTLVSMNCWGLSSQLFPLLEQHFSHFLKSRGTELKSEFYLPSFIDALIREGGHTCDVVKTSGQWFGVTYPEDRSRVRDQLRKLTKTGEYPSPLL